MSTSTVEAEVERRAKAAGVPPVVIRQYVRTEMERWAPVRIDYVIGKQNRLADVTHYPEIGVTHIQFDVGHPFVQRVMLHDDTSQDQRTRMEIVLATILMGRPDYTPEEERWHLQMMAVVSDRLGTAIDILLKPDPKTGLNMWGESDEPDPDDPEFL